MFKLYASSSHSYTNLILALGIVREPTLWVLLLQNILTYMKLGGLLGGHGFTAENRAVKLLDMRPTWDFPIKYDEHIFLSLTFFITRGRQAANHGIRALYQGKRLFRFVDLNTRQCPGAKDPRSR